MINRVFMVAMLMLLSAGLCAASVDNLYQAEVAVASQGQSDRNQAIAEAFRVMLIKVTGDRNIASTKALTPMLRQSSRYVQQYRYRLVEPDQTDAGAAQIRLLNVLFDKVAVDRMLRQTGLPVWGSVRPQVLAWVGFDKDHKRNLLIPDSSPKLATALKDAAGQRGIPFLLPLMDLDDQAAVSSSDLWGEFEKPIRQASARYAADMILLVRVSQPAAGLWRAKWSLLDNYQTQSWENQGQQLFALLDEGIQQMADQLANRYAPAGGADVASLNMRVAGVDSFEQLLLLQTFLQRQELVENFQVRFVESGSVVLTLKLRGGAEALVQSLALSGFLVPDEAAENLPDTESPAPEPGPVGGAEGASPDAIVMPPEPPPAVLYQAQLYYRLR